MLRKSLVFLTACMVLNLGEAKAMNIDPFTFCNNTCKPSQCNGTIKDMCKKTCMKGGIWEQVASLELSKSSREFRQLRDKDKKLSMLYSSDIAKCLELKDPKIKEEKPKVEILAPVENSVKSQIPAPAQAPAPMPSKAVPSMSNVRNDLCRSALQAEIDALNKMDKQIESQVKELESALGSAPEAK